MVQSMSVTLRAEVGKRLRWSPVNLSLGLHKRTNAAIRTAAVKLYFSAKAASMLALAPTAVSHTAKV